MDNPYANAVATASAIGPGKANSWPGRTPALDLPGQPGQQRVIVSGHLAPTNGIGETISRLEHVVEHVYDIRAGH